jgi:hypothetical protein
MKKFLSIAVICCVVAMTGIFSSCGRIEDGDWQYMVKLDSNTPEGVHNNYYLFYDQIVVDNMKASADRYSENTSTYVFRGEKKAVSKRAENAFNKSIDAVEAARPQHPGILVGGTKINLILINRDTNKEEIVLTRTLKED